MHRRVNLLLKRNFFSQHKVAKLEAEALAHKDDPLKQAQLYKELLSTGNYSNLIYRYENQPQLPPSTLKYPAEARAQDLARIQANDDCLKAYITALSREGKIDVLSDKLKAAIQSIQVPSSTTASSNKNNPAQPLASTDKILHYGHTQIPQWNSRLGSRSPFQQQQFQQQYQSQNNSAKPEPIEVVLSEAWSWSKLSRKVGSKVIYGVLMITGLSVILEQQGILKSNMSSAEMQPNSTEKSLKFSDVEGVDEAKHELEELVAFLKDPSKFLEVGGRLPKGILLYGPPGTGKTHLARAVAGEAGVPFFQMSGSEFEELYVGVGAKRVRELFAAARKKAPCIIFIDEIDAIGGKRSAKDQSFMRQTLNQLLVELDGFSSTEGVIFIGATNTEESLDKALVRPGRLDRRINVPLPDVGGRHKILDVHARTVSIDSDVDMKIIARGTPGFSGADLANVINQAALKASKDGSKAVRMEDLEWAKDKIIMGSERKSAIITDKNKRLTAYHEGGHALVALHTPAAMPLHKVTVIPRGNALGLTVQLPDGDVTSVTRNELLARLDVCMGGRVAEEMIFGTFEVTTGASSDLTQATKIAKGMVLNYGMSDKFGVMAYSQEDLDGLSAHSKVLIESEIKSLLDESTARVTHLLKTKKVELDRLAAALITYETLGLEEVKKVVKGIEIDKKI